MHPFLSVLPYATALAGFVGGVLLTGFALRYRSNAERARCKERLRAADKSIADLEAGSAHLEAELQRVRQSEASMMRRHGELEAMARDANRATEEKRDLLEEAEKRLAATFEALSRNALKASQDEFARYARDAIQAGEETATNDLARRRKEVASIVKPVTESLDKVQERIAELEKAREGAYSSLHEQVREMTTLQKDLQKETGQLARVLRQPGGRGRWGELQLQRVVELAGMEEFCDFTTSRSPGAARGADAPSGLVVKLPGGQQVAVDTGVPMGAYLAAAEADNESDRQLALAQHATQVAEHLQTLGADPSGDSPGLAPLLAVMFFPNESALSTALAADPDLIEKGAARDVVLATPSSLIALLRAVACGWRQESIAANARAISEVGRELHERISLLTDHFARMGRSLDSTVRNYNKALGTVETTVVRSAQRLEALGSSDGDSRLPATREVAHHPRIPNALSSLPLSGRTHAPVAAPEPPSAADRFEGFEAGEDTAPFADPPAAPADGNHGDPEDTLPADELHIAAGKPAVIVR